MENLNTSSCLTNGETKEQRNKRLAYDFYRYIGNADYEKAKAMCDPNEFIFHPMIYINADLDGFIDLEAMHMDPMPGFTFTICNIIAEGDWVAVHWIYDGVLDGDSYMGMPCTENARQVHDIMSMLRFNAEGKIVEKTTQMVEASDTMGAGDSFLAAFLCSLYTAGWQKAKPMPEQALLAALAAGQQVSARNCMAQGGFGCKAEISRDSIE